MGVSKGNMFEIEVKKVSLYNTRSRGVEEFAGIRPGYAGVYCCGPTVYNYQHIGNLRTYIFEDLLTRVLRRAGYQVTHVMNITDVGHLVSDADDGEDKMALAAKREGKRSHDIASYYTDIFFEHCAWLNIRRPDIVCKATEHISEMIELIKMLEHNGYAYQAGGNVYFDVARFSRYGDFARLDMDNLLAGARIDVDSNKRGPLDFALWFTKSKFENQELQWDSPWGRGYPGWHIECSAMARRYLGDSFDVHCGGIDHIPVHHTNEIAQSECATGKCQAKFWLHGGFLTTASEKMSKSTGEFLTLDVLKKREIEPLAYRFFCLGGHYRKELAWSWEAVESAGRTLVKMRRRIDEIRESVEEGLDDEFSQVGLELLSAFDTAVFADLGIAKAMAVVHETISDEQISSVEKLKLLSSYDEVLGLDLMCAQKEVKELPEDVVALAKERDDARQAKNWSRADEIRNQLQAAGYLVEDTADGTKVKK
ncbi:MAG: cysteine--tRNA ligase [bacterium]|nr:cysteine--tRNA ligase [bacterium]